MPAVDAAGVPGGEDAFGLAVARVEGLDININSE